MINKQNAVDNSINDCLLHEKIETDAATTVGTSDSI